MDLVLKLTDWLAADRPAHAPPAPAPRKDDWPLMGDIVSARGGVPEHLIRWRRARQEADPDPQL